MGHSVMRDILNDAAEVKPLMAVNGKEVYSFDESVKLSKAELMEEKASGKIVDLGERTVNPDGITYASSNIKRAAIDPGTYFANRYRKTKTKDGVKYEVVTDYRAIKEQGTGRVYTDNIIAHVVAKNAEGKLVVETNKVISADEFVRNFKNMLDTESMIKILDVLRTADNAGMEADKLEL